MSDAPIQISPAALAAADDDRFHRFRLIEWWDQAKLRNARVLVVGAGALGNEIVKNLALLGVGNVLIADLDRVENSNLSRSVLYRKQDNGRFKADVAAASARDIYPDIVAHAFNGNIVYDLGLGVFHWADVIMGGLDNREARLSINRNCYRCSKPWIDGAIQQIDGTARVFIPETHALGRANTACYECTMSQTDWRLLQLRRSCNLLSKTEMETGKTPTTPTISSIIAGVQCQEAIKILHGMDTIAGKGWVFNGITADSYLTEFQRKDACYSHDPLEEIVAMDWSAHTTTARDALSEARRRLGAGAELELARDVLEKLVCPKCGATEELFASLGNVKAEKANCPNCPGVRREVVTFYKIRGDESFLDRPLAAIGVPAFDILIARTPERATGLELSADAGNVLGPLPRTRAVANEDELEWT
ncbi:MAG TPA: ThiF family adenylyltransferase [Tepidisphaeraceae bacterium]|nr:ThiF family adenylyltransferase [Tepidisphaeraceae bacterium]